MTESDDDPEPSGVKSGAGRPSLVWVVVLSTWCGLVAGLLEVATFVVGKWFFDTNQLYWVSRDFAWLIPVTNLVIFVVLGLLAWLVGGSWSGRGRRWVWTGTCAFLIFPALLVAFPRIYGLALLAVALGLASWVVPTLQRRASRVRRLVSVSWPVVAGIVAVFAAWPRAGDQAKQAGENARAMPGAGSPNVLLVVLDTVAAGHLGLYGHSRATSPTLVELAERGIRFDAARSGSSWTLSSHATMFTGRWLHELSAGWLTPLDGAQPTVAEFLGEHGYATAGFVANFAYCARDSGLARGFTHYEDYWFPALSCFKMAKVVSRSLEGIQAIEDLLESELEIYWFRPRMTALRWLLDANRKPASEVNREFLEWLSNRGQRERPFFGFLNYLDAHAPYVLPPGRPYRFGAVPDDNRQRDLIQKWNTLDKHQVTASEIEFAATAYDECVADLDEQLGVLFDELERRGELKRTWLFIVADHGESFGEHTGVFCHGSSLYQSEVHVPLLIVPPGGTNPRVVGDAVSLRDLPATIADVLRMADGSRFPGSSLAKVWGQGTAPARLAPKTASDSLTEVVPLDPNVYDELGLPHTTWPLGGLVDEDWSYIRREHDAREELFHLRVDRKEQRNRADDPEALPALERMRARLNELTGGPLTSERFKP